MRLTPVLSVLLLGMLALPSDARAQQRPSDVAEQAGSMSQEEALQRVRESGMSRSEMRSQLQMLGYDPNLADPYFDAMDGRAGTPSGAASSDFVQALNRMNARPDTMSGTETDARLEDQLLRADYRFRADSIFRARMQRRDSIALAQAGISDLGLPLFGRSVFIRQTTEFEPVTQGPVAPDYRLGPGDEVDLVITGDVELAYPLIVDRSGYLIIPDVGQVAVNGLTLAQLEDVLYDRIGRVYSGVRRGPEATTRFHVTLGRLRADQVFLVGEVERPGAYTVSAVGSAFNALYEAGGPAVTGSFRTIEVRRGGRTAALIDIYGYLLQGETPDHVQLRTGDMLFVPLAGTRATVTGAVRRPAVYELREGEGLRDLLGFAGGFRAQAVVDRVQISRILPPEERRPGVDRVVVDVPLSELLNGEQSIPIRDGDLVTVFEVSGTQRQFVQLTGEVHRPGRYEWRPGLTLEALLDQAEGLDSAAYRARAHIFRLDASDGTRELIQVSLDELGSGLPTVLSDRDSVVVYSREDLVRDRVVELTGFVERPGSYELAEGMTLQDLVLAAGGYTHGAFELEAEIARMPDPQSRTDTTARVIRVSLADTSALASGDRGDVPSWQPTADEIPLRHGDRVFIRRAPGFENARVVVVTGEVMFPGVYVLESRHEQLVDLIQRAGGLTRQAHPSGFQLIRDGHLVGTDLARALEDPDSRHNVRVEAGDSLHLPPYDPTVLITGAVAFETRALYEPGKGLDYYINQAGGYTDDADKGRVSVTYQNGERQVVDRVLLWRMKPDVRPGSSVHVPLKPPNAGFSWDRFLTQSLAVATTAATVAIAVSQIK